MEKILHYEVKTTWKEGRVGEINSTVLNSVIEVASPTEFAKGNVGIWSPEHLLVGAVSSSYMTSFLAMAEKMKLIFTQFSCSAILFLDRSEGMLKAIQIAIHPIITINKSSDSAKGLKVLNNTVKLCIVTTILKTEITIMPEIIIEPEVPV